MEAGVRGSAETIGDSVTQPRTSHPKTLHQASHPIVPRALDDYIDIDGNDMGKAYPVILSLVFGFVAACQSIDVAEHAGSA